MGLSRFRDYFRKKEEPKPEPKVRKEFDIEEFNEWFKNDFEGYDGRKGAAGIFLRTDKLSSYWVEDYLKHIGQDPTYEDVQKYYQIVRKDWMNKSYR